tara:strand:- start:275 stop:865 length:591 start_codon:yes stop_codon:yes gene_type:complete
MNKLYVFDLDGVLIDSLQNMSQAWDAVRVKHEIDTPFEDYKAQIGKPFPDIMRELGLYHRHFEIYQTYKTYSRLHYDMIPLYEGVFETLTELKNRGHKIALCTSKARDSVKLIEHKLPEFDIISCPKQGLRGKPAPDQLLHCMAYCNVDPVDTIYVGDMIYDQQAAHRAGVHFEYATWGFGDIECAHSLKSISHLI